MITLVQENPNDSLSPLCLKKDGKKISFYDAEQMLGKVKFSPEAKKLVKKLKAEGEAQARFIEESWEKFIRENPNF